MSGEAWLYLFAVLINAVNLFLQVFFTIMYSDLEWYVAYSVLNPDMAGPALGNAAHMKLDGPKRGPFDLAVRRARLNTKC